MPPTKKEVSLLREIYTAIQMGNGTQAYFMNLCRRVKELGYHSVDDIRIALKEHAEQQRRH